MRPKQTRYKGCWFRSRLEARWAVFFDTVGVKWWYEPDGFDLSFDLEEFAKSYDSDTLLEAGVRKIFRSLDGKTYSYLPDFYLPELNYWIEVKGPEPSKVEIEKVFMLYNTIYEAGLTKIDETIHTEDENERAWNDLINQGVYLFYGDIPWPFPQEGNILGYGRKHNESTDFFHEPIAENFQQNGTFLERLNLAWMECPLCFKIGIGGVGLPYCSSCHDGIAHLIWMHLWEDRGWSVGKIETTKVLMNREFFTAGHKSPRLQKAYAAARSARFEHGESPNP